MRKIVIAGGIGAGKTAVTDYLAQRGFEVIDADVLARSVTEPGAPAWQALRDAFGDAVLDAEGRIDRAFLADVVFHDESALRRLNAITHGHIGVAMSTALSSATGEGVFVAIPLFRPEHRENLAVDEVWAIQVEPEEAVRRLVAYRGFTPDDARARIESQMSNEERQKIVDVVIWNDGTLAALYQKIDAQLEKSGLGRG